ncbi:ribbon-helix-helix protein, CopG family [Cryobacterium sp. Y11]|uniref:ribbon-helix-helix protein, CopG family n=1 Tax=Cryobacterium sp. Y11 TaxID=2045016 RepID=UPI000CE326F1|nr:ribbon-helix-helix protein, CopG family [Cryobacterium sp. Y11]
MALPIDYDRLAADLTDPSAPLPTGVGRALTGDAAAAEGRAFLLREYGSPEALEAAMRPGRPPLRARTIGTVPKQGSSPIVKGRVPVEYVVAIKELEKRTGKSQSALVRDAMTLLLKENHLIES